MTKKYNPDFLYDLATLLREKKELGKAIYVYKILINDYDYSTYSSKAYYDLEEISTNDNKVDAEKLNIDQYQIKDSFSLSHNDLFNLIFNNSFLFILLGPLLSICILPWPLPMNFVLIITITYAYIIGAVPAAVTSIVFSLFIFYFMKKYHKRPRLEYLAIVGALSGTAFAFLTWLILLYPNDYDPSNKFYGAILYFSAAGLLGGGVSGFISGLVIKSYLKPCKELTFIALKET
jgi:hypothetical protein